jgi:predicted transcriptional regulator of viral defense system
MPKIKYKAVLERVFRKPVFRPEDMHNEGMPKNYSKKLLHVLARTERIKRIERGKYTCLDDSIAVAAHITEPCYLSLWTAMSIRNLTDQIPFAIEVLTPRKRFKKKINFLGTPIIFHNISTNLMFGYENIIWKESVRIPVANPEKIVIDAVCIGGIPINEILQIIKHADITLLKKYAKLTGNRKTENKIKEMIKCSQKKR